MEVDFLLIGQGLAGTVLSYRLIKAGFKVHLIDKDEEGTSSKVAAGLYNPITG
ncbi:MAG: FAD-binding protein, partial [Cyclobacteriaceae bacterium]